MCRISQCVELCAAAEPAKESESNNTHKETHSLSDFMSLLGILTCFTTAIMVLPNNLKPVIFQPGLVLIPQGTMAAETGLAVTT